MKKLAYIILGFVIGAILTYKFCPREAVDTLYISYKTPKDTITVRQATKLSDNWAKYNPTEMDSLIEVEGSKKVTRSVWWSLKDVNEYLIYAKEKSDSLGYNMTGIRVYLGNYGKNVDASKKNRNTMFIVPTGNKNKSKASSLSVFLPPTDNDIPAPPLNDGTGSGNGYPQ